MCTVICGDGVRFGLEACDDGNEDNGDGCSSQCEVESGVECEEVEESTQSICQPICGDGVIVLDEQCDDQNVLNDDGCSSTC